MRRKLTCIADGPAEERSEKFAGRGRGRGGPGAPGRGGAGKEGGGGGPGGRGRGAGGVGGGGRGGSAMTSFGLFDGAHAIEGCSRRGYSSARSKPCVRTCICRSFASRPGRASP